MTQTQTQITNSAATADTFETEMCSRCGGTGHYSYCQMWGTRCFKCYGRGLVYSKRGLAAREFALALRSVKATEIQAGWKVYVDRAWCGRKSAWATVTECGLTDDYVTSHDGKRTQYFRIATEYGVQMVFADRDVQAVPDTADLVAIKARALEYQATLSKTGKPTAATRRLAGVAANR